jgi:hypothetical protein
MTSLPESRTTSEIRKGSGGMGETEARAGETRVVGNDEDRLKALLLEYQTIRGELLDVVKFQFQVYTVALPAVSAFLGLVLVYQKFEALIIFPVITILLAYRFVWDLQVSSQYSEYLVEVEKEKLPKLIGFLDPRLAGYQKYWIAWQNYYWDYRRARSHGWFFSIFLLLGLPTLASYAYFLFYFKISWEAISKEWVLLLQYPYFLYLAALLLYPIPCIHIIATLLRIRVHNIWRDNPTKYSRSMYT